jgi:hypothetical protein
MIPLDIFDTVDPVEYGIVQANLGLRTYVESKDVKVHRRFFLDTYVQPPNHLVVF